MISFECKCGKALRVDDRFAGKLGRCPKCGEQIRIPGGVEPKAPQQAAPVPPEQESGPDAELSSLAAAGEAEPNAGPRGAAGRSGKRPAGIRRAAMDRRALEITAAFFMLGTIFLPWMIAEKEIIMSWDVLKVAHGSVNIFLIGAWIIAVAAIVLSYILNRKAIGFAYGGLGLVGALLLLVVLADAGRLAIGPVEALYRARTLAYSDWFVLGVFGAMLLLTLIVLANLRLRLGARLPIRIVEGIAGGGLAIVAVVWLFYGVAKFADLPEFVKDKLLLDHVVGILWQLAMITGYVLAVVDAATGRDRRSILSAAVLVVIYVALAAIALYVFVRIAVVSELPGVLLLGMNILFLVVPVVLLLCSGAVRSVCQLVSSAERARAVEPDGKSAAATDGTVKVRLARLMALRNDGLITEEEYALERRRILAEV